MDKNKCINEVIKEIMPRKLREFRKRTGLKAEEVAKIINKTPAMITNYEKGNSIPSAATLYELCRIYNVEDMNEIFTDESLFNNFKCNEYLTRPECEVIKLWRASKKEGKFAAKVLLEAFKEDKVNI